MGNIENNLKPIKKSKVKSFLKKALDSEKPTSIIDSHGLIIDVNDKFLNLFEASSKDQMIKSSIFSFFPKIQPHMKMQSEYVAKMAIQKALNNQNGSFELELQCQNIQNTKTWVRTLVTPFNIGKNLHTKLELTKSGHNEVVKIETKPTKLPNSTEPRMEEIEIKRKQIKQLKFELKKLETRDPSGTLQMKLMSVKDRFISQEKEAERLSQKLEVLYDFFRRNKIKYSKIPQLNQDDLKTLEDLKLEIKRIKFEIKQLQMRDLSGALQSKFNAISDKLRDRIVENNELQQEFTNYQIILRDLQRKSNSLQNEDQNSIDFDNQLPQIDINDPNQNNNNNSPQKNNLNLDSQEKPDSSSSSLRERAKLLKNRVKKIRFEADQLQKRAENKNHLKLQEKLDLLQMQYKIKLQENHKLKMKYQTLKNSISRSEMLTDGITEDPTEITENTYLTDSDLSDEVDIESESDERKSKKNPLKIIRNQKRVSSPESGAIKKHITNKTNHLLNQKPRTTSFISNRNEKSKNTIPDSEDPNINKIQETISFENILSDPIKLAYFKDFLCEQFSQELVLCLIAIQKFKSISDSSKMLIHSTIIFKKFIRPESLFEINLNIEVRNQIQERILKNDIEITMFDQIENTILEDLKNNYYTPFIRSTHMALYQKHKNNEEEKENTTNQKTQQKEIKAIMVSKRREHSTLNEGYVFKGISREPHVIGEELAELMIDMCAAHFSISTEQIDFDQISQTIIFRRFVIATSELQVISLDNIDYPERLALFINIYNVLFVHSAIVSGVPTDKATKTRFMNESKYNIGGYLFSLSDIKHGILRGNRPKRNWRSGSYFKPKDKRANLQVVPLDPRIHFALTNLTIQSAPLRVYYLDRLNDELENTTKSFLLKNVRVSIKSKKILLPKVFRSSPKDFGQNQKDIFRFLSRYIPDLFQELSPNAFTIKFIGSNLSPMLVFESEYSSI